MRLTFAVAALALGASLQSIGLKGDPLGSGELTYFQANPTNGTSKAVVIDNLSIVHPTQILPFEAPGKIMPGRPADQTQRVLANLLHALSFAQSDLSQLIKLNVYISHSNDIADVKQVLAREFSHTKKPAMAVVVSDLPDPDALVAIDAVAAQRLPFHAPRLKWVSPPDSCDREICTAAVLPPGPLFYVSGMADTNNPPEATRITLTKLMCGIGHLGLTQSDVVQLKAFFQPMSEAATV